MIQFKMIQKKTAHFKLKLRQRNQEQSSLIPREERKLREQQKKKSLLVNSMRLARRARSKQDRLTRRHLEYLLLRLVLPPLTPRSNRTSNLQRAAKETLATLSKNARPAKKRRNEFRGRSMEMHQSSTGYLQVECKFISASSRAVAFQRKLVCQ